MHLGPCQSSQPPADEVDGSPFEILYTTLSSQSGAADTKHVMETFLMKRRKNVFGPPVGKVWKPEGDFRIQQDVHSQVYEHTMGTSSHLLRVH